jgi:hypothetical protein
MANKGSGRADGLMGWCYRLVGLSIGLFVEGKKTSLYIVKGDKPCRLGQKRERF